MLKLKKNPTLTDFQKYVSLLEIERGFDKETVLEKCLLLGEETGELFKAVRKVSNIKTDQNSKPINVSEELADIFIYLCAISNRFKIDLESAFRQKEEKNKLRVWE